MICGHCGYQESRSMSDFGYEYQCPSCEQVTDQRDWMLTAILFNTRSPKEAQHEEAADTLVPQTRRPQKP